MNYSKPHIHELIFQYFQNRELDELYISVFLKSLAESFISIFIPIYLLTLGYELRDVAIYFLVYFTTISLVFPLCMFINSRIGIKKTMALGLFSLVVYYLLLNLIGQGLSYAIVAVIYGVSIALYYAAFHIEFAVSTERKMEAKAVSILKTIPIITAVIGPVIGALFIIKLSFTFLFFIVAIILLASIIPLFFTKDFSVPMERFSIKKVWRSDSKEKALAYQASGLLAVVSGIFWPVFIYLTIKDILSLGGIISLTSLLMVAVLIYLGRQTDKDTKKTLTWGIFTHAPFWIIRMFLLTPVGLFISNFFASATHSAIDISLNKLIYEKAKKTKNLVNYFLFREFNLEIGRVFILVMAIVTNSIIWLFIVAFFATFIHLVLYKEIKRQSLA